MSEYQPDRWVVIHIKPTEECTRKAEEHYRVFGMWYGGYAHGDSWRMNSGIVRVEEDELFYYFHGETGSVYTCRKSGYGFTPYGYNVFSDIIKRSFALDISFLPDETDFSKLEYKMMNQKDLI